MNCFLKWKLKIFKSYLEFSIQISLLKCETGVELKWVIVHCNSERLGNNINIHQYGTNKSFMAHQYNGKLCSYKKEWKSALHSNGKIWILKIQDSMYDKCCFSINERQISILVASTCINKTL